MMDLTCYDVHRENLKNMIREADKKITPKKWEAEIDELASKYEETEKPFADVITHLARAQVLTFNKSDLEMMLRNERKASECKQD